MPYGNFNFDTLKSALKLQYEAADRSFFPPNLLPVETDPYFEETIRENVQLAQAVNSEKARSELLIAPILIQVRKLMNREISVFSGVAFNVDSSADLVGVPDFIVSYSPVIFHIEAPVLAVVEAKKENLTDGVPQCAAELAAIARFNARKDVHLARYYGAVTDGTEWLFVRLEPPARLTIDFTPHALLPVERICAILIYLLNDAKNSGNFT